MSVDRRIAAVVLGVWVACALSSQVPAVELRSDTLLIGQVREGDQSGKTDSPVDLYGDMGVANLRHGITADTYFRLAHDFATGQGPTDFYAGYMRVPGAIPHLDFTLGRQFLSETPGGVFVADAGKVRIDTGGPVSLTLFGGQPQYFEPTYSSPSLSQDEIIFGGNLQTTRWRSGHLSLGYLQQERQGRELRQLITAAGARSFTQLPGLPNVYGAASFDADHQNIDQITAGFDTFLLSPRLRFNFESGYYKPQDQGKRLVTNINRREDPIFQLFSLSQMLQFRGGLRYAWSPQVSAFADYSYQRYEKLSGIFENGHIANVGLVWLPGGDGLELVRVEYYLVNSDGGNVNGGRAAYESRVYDRILFRTKADVTYYQKEYNYNNTAVSTLLGLGYDLAPGLFCEVYMEANRNQRFNDEFRFGFHVSYNFRYRTDQPPQPGGAS